MQRINAATPTRQSSTLATRELKDHSMPSHIDYPVVVITGASSGIGRATAHAFVKQGASVVLAARRADMLHEVARECVNHGGSALVVPTDTTQEDQVENLAAQALDQFGRIDVWFNNAGVGVFGRFEDVPSDVWRRVIETNLFGYVYGAKAAMRQFRAQGYGVMINNASIVGRLAKADSTAYATSKFAVRGFSEALRQEVLDQHEIHICTILPSVIDTPFFHHAANSAITAFAPPRRSTHQKKWRALSSVWQKTLVPRSSSGASARSRPFKSG
jgi:NAD(P)-dependent dehydrogenase (short-subunit alcohol dehydrogenase family)